MNMMQQFAASSVHPQKLSDVQADAIIHTLEKRGPICSFCLNPIRDKAERSEAETFRFRCVLMIPDAVPTPIVCDGCFDTATASYNSRATNVGTSNSGPTNMVLQQLG